MTNTTLRWTTDIDAIRQREQAASRPPWRAHTEYPHTVWQGTEEDPHIVSTTLSMNPAADAEFIAGARTDIPTLLNALTEARGAAERLLHMERQHAGSGRDGHLSEADLLPLLEALGISTREPQ